MIREHTATEPTTPEPLPGDLASMADPCVPTVAVYLTWGGTVYGPAGIEEVLAGCRTSWFEEETMFWFEGQDRWLPIKDFPSILDHPEHGLAARQHRTPPRGMPREPGKDEPDSPRRRRGRQSRGSHRGRHRKATNWLVAGLVLLAVLVTVGITLALMFV